MHDTALQTFSNYSSPCLMTEDILGFMGTTPPTHACAVRFMNFGADTKFEKGASDRNSPTVSREKSVQAFPPIFLQSRETKSGTESLGSRLVLE